MKVPQHPNIALAIEALEKSNMDAAWHLLRAVPKETEVAVIDCHTTGVCVQSGLRAEPPAAPVQEADTYAYAKQIAVAIWEKHYKTIAPKWEPCDELMAVLTQIDNMVAALTTPPAQPAPVQPAKIGTIGHIDNGKATLTASILSTLQATPPAAPAPEKGQP